MREAGASAPGSENHGCPCPRAAPAGVRLPGALGDRRGWLGAEQSPLACGLCTTLVEDAAAMLEVRAMGEMRFQALCNDFQPRKLV